MNNPMRLLALLLTAAALWAQPTTTPIRDTIRDQFGALYTGTATIQLAAGSTTSGVYTILSLVGDAKRIRITSGVLSVNLIPNDTMPSGMSYLATLGNGARLTCIIPTSATPITLAGYCANAAPSKLLWLNHAGLGDGVQCIDAEHGVVTASTGCGGGTTWGSAVGTWGSNSLVW